MGRPGQAVSEVEVVDVIRLWPGPVPVSVAMGTYDAARADAAEFSRDRSRRTSTENAVRSGRIDEVMKDASRWLERHHDRLPAPASDWEALRAKGWTGTAEEMPLWMVLACSMRARSLVHMFSVRPGRRL